MDLRQKEKQTIINTYNRQPESTLFIKRGEGVFVWDDSGNRYLDFVSGLSVNNLGHCHPSVVEAICKQAEKLLHTSNLYYTEPQIQLAKELVSLTGADKVFFCNSGAEANEAAIKLARKYGKAARHAGAHEIITAGRSFHGRTMATITATAQTKYHKGFEPMLPGFRYAEFNNLKSFEDLINEKTCAILVEPVQGEGGVYPATQEFMQGLRSVCDEHGLLLLFDEVQCGLGRTGKLLAAEHYGVAPDIFTLAKALGGGLPIGAMAARGACAETLVPGDHASTFGGNPVACAAALATLQVISEHTFLPQVERLGKYFMEKLSALNYDGIVELRGLGLMVGLEISGDGAQVVKLCQDNGLIINCVGGKTLRFLPPLVVQEEHIDAAVNVLQKALRGLQQQVS